MLPQQYCLRWKYHHSNLQTMFSQLLDRGCFCDVTLACEGQVIRAHRVVLCACSTYFDTILTNYAAERDPIIIMKDAKFSDVKCLIEFMYKGEINVEHASLASLLKTAEELKIKGLAEVSWREDEMEPYPLDTDLKYSENTDVQQNQQQQQPNQIQSHQQQHHNHNQHHSNIDTIPRMPLLTPIPSPNHQENSHAGPKRKRGRPPLDEEYDVFSTPKISYIEGAATAPFQENTNIVEQSAIDETGKEPNSTQPDEWVNQDLDGQMNTDHEPENDIIAKTEPHNDYFDPGEDHEDSDSTDHGSNSNFHLTPQEQEEWKDVIKMDAYLARGRRPQFWEESFTKRVMEAIKTKELEMKKAAQLLGVSYGTLYGRYRETYGCLKHPYRSANIANFRSLQI